jgi:hypothetical protein
MPRLESCGLGHPGDDVGLGDGLPLFDGQRNVPICKLGEARGKKAVPWNVAHRSKHTRVNDAALRQSCHQRLATLCEFAFAQIRVHVSDPRGAAAQ